MNAKLELKKQLLQGMFTIIAALIGAAGVVIAAKCSQEISVLKAENSQLEETISVLKAENSQLRERISVLEDESEVSTDTDTDLVEDLIAQNLDTILQKKAQYTDLDTEQIECGSVRVSIHEKAGCMYYSLQKTDNPEILAGNTLSVPVYFLDYETNDVIYTLSSSEYGTVEYFPGDTRKFYCVVITSEYELYVSKPIQALGGESWRTIDIFLDKADSKYSPLFQVRLQACDSSQTTQDFSILSGAAVTFHCVDRYSDHSNVYYKGNTTNSGIANRSDKCFFSLNTRYVLDISLDMLDVSSGEEMPFYTSPYKTIDGLVKNTNLIDIFFEYDGSKLSLR